MNNFVMKILNHRLFMKSAVSAGERLTDASCIFICTYGIGLFQFTFSSFVNRKVLDNR